jgi:hypothetical protein
MQSGIKRDPSMRRIGRKRPATYLCAGPGCENELNEITVKNLDPFCSTACAHEYHGVEIQMPGRGVTVGSSS